MKQEFILDLLLRVLNVAGFFTGVAMVVYGWSLQNGLQGLGLALIMTTAICYFGIHYRLPTRKEQSSES